MKKGQILEGVIEKVEFPNKGLVYVAEEDQYVLVKNGIPGQKIRFGINKFKHGRAEGRLLEVLERSPLETREPVCSLFPACGGCMYQTMSYEAQLEMKAEQMKEIMRERLHLGIRLYLRESKRVRKSLATVIRWSFHLAMNTKTDRFLLDFIKKEAPTTF